MVLDYIEKYTPNEEERERIMVTLSQKAQSRIKQPTIGFSHCTLKITIEFKFYNACKAKWTTSQKA